MRSRKQAASQTDEKVISSILNWVCPECGGRMGDSNMPFKCQGDCQTDWRAVWERNVAPAPSKMKAGKKQASAAHSASSEWSSAGVGRESRPTQ